MKRGAKEFRDCKKETYEYKKNFFSDGSIGFGKDRARAILAEKNSIVRPKGTTVEKVSAGPFIFKLLTMTLLGFQ